MAQGASADAIIEAVFQANVGPDLAPFQFERKELPEQALRLGIPIPKNIGDTIYQYRSRRHLPESIRRTAPDGWQWVIRSAGRAVYEFSLARLCFVEPRMGLQAIKVLNATPEIVSRYRFSDEQALLAVLRYNRLVDLFTTTTCYLLQSHLRTTVEGLGQVETDDLYVGVGRGGTHFAIPLQAKGANEKVGVIQIEQDFAVCRQKLPGLKARPLAAQFLTDGVIALLEFALDEDDQVVIADEKHYRLVPQEDLSEEELRVYSTRD